MSATYRPIDWNRQKRRYDLALLTLLVSGLATFAGVAWMRSSHFTVETVLIRSTAVAALVLLHVILCIGPLARLDSRFLPFLYNRRHLGVTLFLLALTHAVLVVIQFHALGNVNPLVSVFTAYRSDYRLLVNGVWQPQHFPFEPFGALALLILFLMAATSHDFWLRQLGASLWKCLHFGVYVAYGSLLAHVGLGVLQSERHRAYPLLLGFGFLVVTGLHLAAALRESRVDRRRVPDPAGPPGFVRACRADAVEEGRGTVAVCNGRRVALFRHQGAVVATSNVCRHQGGPVGEGRIVDGCITCPWHGWSYRPEDGCSPPPFTEVLPTYETRLIDGDVWVRSDPRMAPATAHSPAAGSVPENRTPAATSVQPHP